MTWLLLLVLVIVLLLLRQNIILVVAVATAYIHVFLADSKLEFLAQDIWFAIDREVLLSIPMFILAGSVMTRGSIARRLIRIMTALTSPVPGGLGVAAVLSCAVFAAISGSSIVTMLAVGAIMYPALLEQGYDRRFAIGALAAGGTLGIIIPPSIPLILYGIMTETSITDLFLAGIGPGLLLTGMMIAYSLWRCRSLPATPWDFGELISAFREGIFALMMPVILLGGIYSGYFTPTESAAVALFYAIVVEVFIHRELRPLETFTIGLDTLKLLGTLLLLLAIAGSLNTILDYEGVPKDMVRFLTELTDSNWILIVGINVLLLIVGCFMDIGSAILILAPLLWPIGEAIGFHPVHFGIVMIVNLELGYLTPPVGINILIGMIAFRESFGTIVRAVVPFLLIMLLALILVIVFPWISLSFIG